MPEKPLTIATYAAGASLAAITLVYVFGPTFFLDGDAANDGKRRGAVGLSNSANDCFINSVLQVLAGLPDLRVYLIRETHRRLLDGPGVYEADAESEGRSSTTFKSGKLVGLRKGVLTHGLKDILDSLNERPIYKKTISPQPFIHAVERSFGTRVSRQQQDAQEFLQIVTERLCDEYHAGATARRYARQHGVNVGPLTLIEQQDDGTERQASSPGTLGSARKGEEPQEEQHSIDEEGFPFEGKIESQIECQTCHFKPKPAASTFVTLTLNVPQVSSTSLNACFDGMLKVEYIDDFKCEWCRLEHAIRSKDYELSRTQDADARERIQSDIAQIRQAMDEDPETAPEGVELPTLSQAPKRRIARHMYISQFPKVLAVHLSRSMFAVGSVSSKNLARVSFPETLPLGGLLHRNNYRLLGLVTHKGSHQSGHYESFRRQVQPQPFSTPVSFGAEGAYSRHASPNPSASPSVAQTPRLAATTTMSPIPSTAALDSPTTHSVSSASSQSSKPRASDLSTDITTPTTLLSPDNQPQRSHSIRSIRSKITDKADEVNPLRRKGKRASNRWWRISDDKIKESRTSEVLGMQREVYLLFYELERI